MLDAPIYEYKTRLEIWRLTILTWLIILSVHFLPVFEDIQVRLVGGSGPHEGRVQVLHDMMWGTVQNSNLDPRDAAVICNQLGYTLVQFETRQYYILYF